MERKRVAEAAKGVGRPKVGGPFTLLDQNGKEFTDEQMKGRYSLVGSTKIRIILAKYGELTYWRSISDSRTVPTSARKSSTKWPK